MSPTAAPPIDRPALIRAALRAVVAERGFHGASMSAIAKAAGVAVGTAYVHYDSKDEVVAAAYREAKDALTTAALEGLDTSLRPADRFRTMWRNMHGHLASHRDIAAFLVQFEASPYRSMVIDPRDRPAELAELVASGDAHPLLATFADAVGGWVDLPATVLFDLGFGAAIRLVATDEQLAAADLDRLADACWKSLQR